MSGPVGIALAPARIEYNQHDEQQTREKIQTELRRALKKNETIYVSALAARLVLTDTADGQLYELKVESGVVTLTAVSM